MEQFYCYLLRKKSAYLSELEGVWEMTPEGINIDLGDACPLKSMGDTSPSLAHIAPVRIMYQVQTVVHVQLLSGLRLSGRR